MKLLWSTLLLTLLPFCLIGLDYVPNQLIFKTTVPTEITRANTGLDSFDSFLNDNNIKTLKPVLKTNQNRFFVATFHQDINWNNIKNHSFDGIEYIQPNYINQMHLAPNDNFFAEQEINLENCDIPDAWNLTTGNEQILIAIVDSGIHFDHPDLQNNIYINEAEIPDDGIDNDGNGYIDDWHGWDFADAPELSSIGLGDFMEQDNDPTDELNHGTHIAGIIGADTNNEIGISGICWNAQILAVRSGFSTNIAGTGYLQDDDAAAGVIYAADMGANIINVSWGDLNYSQIIADACNYAYLKGSIIVASAGNEGASPNHIITYPAKLSTTIAVGAVNNIKELASFSSWGEEIDLVAPGNIILSTYSPDDLYKEMSGTSMAAPFVVGSIGLLLSNEPELSFEEVRGRLISSASELGAIGFDYIYGNGMLNVYDLLVQQNYPQIVIDSPYDHQGLSESFEIIGTVNSNNFWRYAVKYTEKTMPEPSDWLDVDPAIQYYTTPVVDDVIAHFELYNSFPENTYKIKIELSYSNNEVYSYIRTIYIDQTPANFYPLYTASMKRFAADRSEYYIQAVFDEEVFMESDLNEDDPIYPYYPSIVADSIQIIKLIPELCESGLNSIDLKAVNISGLETIVEDAFQMNVEISSVPEYGMTSEIGESEVVSVKKTYDFDGNGIKEFVCLSTIENEQTLQILEPSSTGFAVKHTFPTSMWPHDMGNSNESGMEIIGLDSDRTTLFDTVSDTYPDQLFFLSNDSYGANFGDYDGDGMDEIILIKNETIEGITYRILSLMNRIGDSFDEEYKIINTTPTSQWNVFANRTACGLLDMDDLPDIVAADNDGDVMIYEKSGLEFVQTWGARLPVPDAFYLELADFTGDGLNEFCVGGYSINYSDPNKTFSYFAFFKNTGEDNAYEQIGYVSFSEVNPKNSISAVDLDGDGDMELFLAVPPNSYVIDFQAGEFVPVWKGNSASTSQNVIATASKTATDAAYIITNVQDGDVLKGTVLRLNTPFSGPPTPQYFSATPLNEHTAELDWHNIERPRYNVYRKKDDVIEQIGYQINESYFLDKTLALGDTVYYRVTTLDSIFSPSESIPTSWKQVITAIAPVVTDIKMVSSYQVQIDFDRRLNNSAANRSHFVLEPDIGLPSTINMIHENKSLILSFGNDLSEIDEYSLSFSKRLCGITGVPVDSGPYIFYYEEDTTTPRILRAICGSETVVNVIFSEALLPETAEDIQNYSLVLPAADAKNTINAISYFEADSSYVTLTMAQPLVYTNQSYFLQIDHVEDLAGNIITGSGNKCHFNLTGNSGPRNLNQLKVYPNPLNMSKSEFRLINFINLPLNTKGELSIFDLSGELIFEKKFGPFVSSIEHVNWNCNNLQGKRISSGMYYYIISMGKDLKRGKIVIIN